MTKAMTKRSMHRPLIERAAAKSLLRKTGAERLLKGKDAEGSFRAGGPKAAKQVEEHGTNLPP